jgi:hypothetical protein
MENTSNTKIAYYDLSRDFLLETVTPNMIILSSVKHRIVMINVVALDVKYKWPYLLLIDPPCNVCPICLKGGEITSKYVCVKCYFNTYEQQKRDKQIVEWNGKEYKIRIKIFKKTQDTFCFQVANIEKIPCDYCDKFVKCNVHNIHKQEYNANTYAIREQAMSDLLNINYMFSVHHIQWYDILDVEYMYDNIIAIRREFAAKMMLIRDFVLTIPIDVWYYVVDLMIESEKIREIIFV